MLTYGSKMLQAMNSKQDKYKKTQPRYIVATLLKTKASGNILKVARGKGHTTYREQ